MIDVFRPRPTPFVHVSHPRSCGRHRLSTPKSGHWLSASGCPLCAKSGHYRHSGHDREVGIERLAHFYHLLAGETAASRKLRDSFEVTVLPTRQAPAQHASRGGADVLKAMHDVARDEDDAAGTGLDGLT